jgi:fructokinase
LFFFDRASSAALHAAEEVRTNGGQVMFEPNGLGRENSTRRAIELATVLKISGSRRALLHLFDCAIDAQLQIQTRGNQGLLWRRTGETWRGLPAELSSSVDSSGAGDWLTSVLLAAMSRSPQMLEVELVRTLRAGQAIAAVSCEYLGARGMNLASVDEVRDKLRRRGFDDYPGAGSRRLMADSLRSDAACDVCLAATSDAASSYMDRLAATSR